MKKGILILISVFFLCTALSAETTLFSVKGSIYFKKQGTIHVLLMNEEYYQENKGGQTPYQVSIKIGPQQLKDKFVSFEIADVPRGRYCIVCFLDTNDNKQLDKGLFGPTEPWCMYNKPEGIILGRPQFKDIAFYVGKDISDIKIELS